MKLALALALWVGSSALGMAQATAEPGVDAPLGVTPEAPPAEDVSNDADAEAVEEEAAEDEYVLGQSALRLEMPAAPLSLSSAPAAETDATATETAPLHRDLELALRLPTYDFDGVSFISASRSLITGVLETYCAAGMLLPGEDGYESVDVILGAGCLLGALWSASHASKRFGAEPG